jgi:hypothetical protein
MTDSLLISYDNCPPDYPTLIVARKDKYDTTMLKTIQGDEAFGIYHYLIGGAELKGARDIHKKPTHIHEEHSDHLWCRDKNGKIDLWAFEEGFCNGPVCTRCWHSECVHCNPEWETDPTSLCVVDKDICSACGSELKSKHKYCPDCGQALDWSD